MIRMTRIIAGAATLAFASLAAGSPAQAEEEEEISYGAIELKDLERGNETLSAERGYIFMQGPVRLTGMFFKEPNEEDVAAYEEEWREELAEARDDHENDVKRWERRRDYAQRRGNRFTETRPEEPTEENFSIGSIELRHRIVIGPQYVYDKGKDENDEKYFQYLHAVPPGTYTYYGPAIWTGEGYAGACYCMGSIKFEVKAGEITNIGNVLMETWASDEAMAQASVMFVPDPERVIAPIDWSTPDGLTGLPIVEADFRAAGKMNNYFRLSIFRLPPMEGVLRYDRDTPVDVKGEIEAAEAAEAARIEEERIAAEQAAAEAAAQAEADMSAAAAAARAVVSGDEAGDVEAGPEG